MQILIKICIIVISIFFSLFLLPIAILTLLQKNFKWKEIKKLYILWLREF